MEKYSTTDISGSTTLRQTPSAGVHLLRMQHGKYGEALVRRTRRGLGLAINFLSWYGRDKKKEALKFYVTNMEAETWPVNFPSITDQPIFFP
jgi:hypothetical protein